VDKELEQRGYAFVRYADDWNVYVRSRRAGKRVMVALERPVVWQGSSGRRYPPMPINSFCRSRRDF
jgi:hypothetical protein